MKMPLPRWSSALLVLLALGAGCSSNTDVGAEPRYPEKRRPPALRSASDGEVMGADEQAPEDTLEVVPTNEHPARGWVVENGVPVPEKEARQGAAKSKAATDCDPNAPAGAAGAGGRPGKPPCPKPP